MYSFNQAPPDKHWHLLKEACEAQANHLSPHQHCTYAKIEADDILAAFLNRTKPLTYAEKMLHNSAQAVIDFIEILNTREKAIKAKHDGDSKTELTAYLTTPLQFQRIMGKIDAHLTRYWYHMFTYLEYVRDLRAIAKIYYSQGNYEEWFSYCQKMLNLFDTIIATGIKWGMLLETSDALRQKKVLLDHLRSEIDSTSHPYSKLIKEIVTKQDLSLKQQEEKFKKPKANATSLAAEPTKKPGLSK